MRLCNKVNQTVKIGREVFIADIRNVSLTGEVMRGKVLMHRGDSKKSIPVRCLHGHRVWLPL